MRSEQINELAKALAAAQALITGAKKDSDNPFFKSRYADLGSVWDSIRRPLSSNGLSVVQTVDGRLIFLVAEGESVPGPILEIGNTNSRYRFPIGARRFVNEWNIHGPAHHCAVGLGHIAKKIEKLGNLLGMETVTVC